MGLKSFDAYVLSWDDSFNTKRKEEERQRYNQWVAYWASEEQPFKELDPPKPNRFSILECFWRQSMNDTREKRGFGRLRIRLCITLTRSQNAQPYQVVVVINGWVVLNSIDSTNLFQLMIGGWGISFGPISGKNWVSSRKAARTVWTIVGIQS